MCGEDKESYPKNVDFGWTCKDEHSNAFEFLVPPLLGGSGVCMVWYGGVDTRKMKI